MTGRRAASGRRPVRGYAQPGCGVWGWTETPAPMEVVDVTDEPAVRAPAEHIGKVDVLSAEGGGAWDEGRNSIFARRRC